MFSYGIRERDEKKWFNIEKKTVSGIHSIQFWMIFSRSSQLRLPEAKAAWFVLFTAFFFVHCKPQRINGEKNLKHKKTHHTHTHTYAPER